MKITGIKTFAIDCFRTNWVFVKVLTDEGIEGIGEGTLEYKENALQTSSMRSSGRIRSTPNGYSTRTTATPTGAAARC